MKYYHQMIITMVDKIVTIKTQHKALKGIRTAKIIEVKQIKYLTRLWRGYVQQKYHNEISQLDLTYKHKLKMCVQKSAQCFLSLKNYFFCVYKMYLISAEGYKNASVTV